MKKIIIGLAFTLSLVVAPQVTNASILTDFLGWVSGAPKAPLTEVASSSPRVIVKLDASSPLSRVIQISKATSTDNVLIANFAIKSQKVSGTLKNITLFIGGGSGIAGSAFETLTLKINGHTYTRYGFPYVQGFAASGLNEPLPADQFVIASLYGKVSADKSGSFDGVTGNATIEASVYHNPDVRDSTNQYIEVVPGIISSNTFTLSSVEVGSTTTTSINLISPTTGQVYKPGDTIHATWTSSSYPGGFAIDFLTSDTKIALMSTSITGNPGKYDFTLSNTTKPGSYIVRLRGSGGLVSTVPFTVGEVGTVVQPIINRFDPRSAEIGATVTLYGKDLNFASSVNDVWIEFGNSLDTTIHPTRIATDGSQLTFTVPNLPAGGYAMMVTGKGLRSNISPFSVTASSSTCFKFTSYLTLGSIGDEVSALQSFLQTRGFAVSDDKGTFGEGTKLALMKYQTAVGLPATGFVGPLTLAKLNMCGPVTPVAGTITVVSPNGGENYVTDSTLTIRYKTRGMIGSKLTAYLHSETRGNVRSVITTATESGSVDMYLAKGGPEDPGQYKITICSNITTTGKDVCDSSDKTFSLNSPTATPLPVPIVVA